MTVSEKQTSDYTKVPTKENETSPEISDTPAQYGYGVRHIQIAVMFLCLTTSFMARGHLGVTIVAMTNPQHTRNFTENIAVMNGSNTELTSVSDMNETEISINVNDTNGISNKSNTEWTIYRTYDWPKPIQETALSSFFLGYCLMTFPMAIICQRWGGKVPLQISLLINGLVSLLTPWLTLWGGWKTFSACRILQGLSQAGTFPGIQTLISKWVPANERASLSSYVYTGSTVGNVIAFQVGGILADSAWGWPSTYWAVGVFCLICFTFLTVAGASTPLVHNTISEEEKIYIVGQVDLNVAQKRKSVPWKDIFTSRPVWATWAPQVGGTVAYVFVFTQVPSFFHYILGLNVKNSGILSSLPYLGSFFSTIGFGLLSDYVTNKKILSNKTARRTFNSISHVGLSVSLVLASFATSTTVAVICFVFALSFFMALHAGWMLNEIDLAPNNSGSLMAIGNSFTNILTVLMPMLVSHIVVDVRNPSQWRTMMCIVAGIAFLANIVFVVFLSVERQPWDKPQINDAEMEDLNQESEKKNNLK